MAPLPNDSDLVRLLHETRWVRSLAGRLVADCDAAEDLAQDACLAALGRPPRSDDNLGGWLRGVMQNLLRQQARSRRRRERREAEVASSRVEDAGQPVDLLVERASVQRAVVDAVFELSPALRDTVLLRYFEDLPPRQVAQRLALPVATVHSRLGRAHELLRRSLDRHRGPGTWQRAFAPLCLAVPNLLTTPLTLLTMNVKSVAAAAAVLLCSALWIGFDSSRASPPEPIVTNGPPIVAEEGPTTTSREAVVDRSAAPVPAPEVAGRAAQASRICRGRIVDARGQALGSLRVRLAESVVQSDSLGAFAVPDVAMGARNVRCDEVGWCTVLEGVVRAGAEPPPVLVVAAPAVRLGGLVRSSRGDAVVGASIQIVWPGDLRNRLSLVSDAASEVRLGMRTSDTGAFSLTAGAVSGAELLVVADGHRAHREPMPMQDATDLVVVLERLEGTPGSVQGIVVDPSGRSVAGACVGLGRSVTSSDGGGNFVIADEGSAESLAATAVGHRRATMPRGPGFASFVVLTLDAEPMTIGGRVVDETGAGVGGVLVWPADATPLCASRDPISVEGFASGCPTMGSLRERFERGEFAGRDPRQVLRETATASWPWVRTAADGTFTVTGLEDRSYRLRAMNEETLQLVEVPDVRAGSVGLRVVLDGRELFASVRGVVVARDGSPVPGVRLRLQIDAQRLQGSTMHGQATAVAVSDAKGRFEMERVPKAFAYLRVEGDDVLPGEPGRGLAGGMFELCSGRPLELRVEVNLRMHVQVELLDPKRADSIVVLDADEQPVRINVFQGNGRREHDALGLVDGRSPVFVVPDTATTLVLRNGGREVSREVLQLRRGDVNALRL